MGGFGTRPLNPKRWGFIAVPGFLAISRECAAKKIGLKIDFCHHPVFKSNLPVVIFVFNDIAGFHFLFRQSQ